MRSPAIVKSVGCCNVAQRAGLGIFKYSCDPLKFILPFARGPLHRAALGFSGVVQGINPPMNNRLFERAGTV